jgi:acyl-CoA thioesterase I
MNQPLYGLVLKYSSMQRLLKILFLLQIMISASLAWANDKQPQPINNAAQNRSAELSILVFGDSLSAAYNIKREQGWVSLLQDLVDQKQLNYTLVNASISGETTSGGLQRFEKQLMLTKPKIVILELGGNDGLRGFDLNSTKQNLIQMIELSHKNNAQVILAGIRIPPNYGRTYSQRFSEIYSDLAAEYDLTLIPFILEKVAANNLYMQADGIHPNAKGQPLIVETVWPYLQQVMQKL